MGKRHSACECGSLLHLVHLRSLGGTLETVRFAHEAAASRLAHENWWARLAATGGAFERFGVIPK
jgi:hypothetical protein